MSSAPGWYLHGEATQQFEHDYAAYIGTRHCIGCGNGYDALWLMFRAAIITGHLRPGDDVIVPANTFIASLLAVSDNGLRPVPVEPRADTLEIDDSLDREIDNATHTRHTARTHVRPLRLH